MTKAPARRALVTGASGFLGRHVLKELGARGIEAVALGRSRPAGLDPARFLALLDAGDAAAIGAALAWARPDVVLHLAGMARAGSLEELYRVNTLFAAHVLDAARRLDPVPAVLLVGSATEYGPVPEAALPVTEATPCRPQAAYGITKLAQTLHGLAAAASGQGVVIARLFNPIGAGMPDYLALGSFARQIAGMGPEGGTLLTGDLDAERDFLLAADAARILVDLVFLPAASGQVVNLCSGRPTSLRLLTERLIAASGRPIRLQRDAARQGVTGMARHYGSAERLRGLGIVPPRLDADHAAAAILSGLPMAEQAPGAAG